MDLWWTLSNDWAKASRSLSDPSSKLGAFLGLMYDHKWKNVKINLSLHTTSLLTPFPVIHWPSHHNQMINGHVNSTTRCAQRGAGAVLSKDRCLLVGHHLTPPARLWDMHRQHPSTLHGNRYSKKSSNERDKKRVRNRMGRTGLAFQRQKLLPDQD